MNDFESRLRDSLRRHAEQAPDGQQLSERIVRATERREPAPRRRRGEWRTWAFPLAAAGAVATLAAVLVGVSRPHHTASPPATDRPLIGSASPGPSGVPTALQSTPPASPTTTAVPPDLTGVRIIDATFDSAEEGWLLVTADCLNGKPGKCTGLLHTTDGGASWQSLPNPPVNLPGVDNCASPCVDHLRFANPSTGYAYGDGYYGSSAFYMTTDGGKTWHAQKGVQAVALETYDNNVIRVSPTQPGCGPPGCTYQVQTSAIGSTTWSAPIVLDQAAGTTTGAQLVRGGDHDAYVLVTGQPGRRARRGRRPRCTARATTAGPGRASASRARRTAWPRSTARRSPRAAATGRVAVLRDAAGAQPRLSWPSRPTRRPASCPAPAPSPWASAACWSATQHGDCSRRRPPAAGQVVPQHRRRAAWQRVVGPSRATSPGPASSHHGRPRDRRRRRATIWATRDGGAHWTPFTFG